MSGDSIPVWATVKGAWRTMAAHAGRLSTPVTITLLTWDFHRRGGPGAISRMSDDFAFFG
jgi:hypothetical protein